MNCENPASVAIWMVIMNVRKNIDFLSVHPSVMLVDCDHTRWNSAKIISRLISLGTWLSADPNITDLLQREHP